MSGVVTASLKANKTYSERNPPVLNSKAGRSALNPVQLWSFGEPPQNKGTFLPSNTLSKFNSGWILAYLMSFAFGDPAEHKHFQKNVTKLQLQKPTSQDRWCLSLLYIVMCLL